MKSRRSCPICSERGAVPVFKYNDLVGIHSLGRERIPIPIAYSRAAYVACVSCGVIFARNVQDDDEYDDYYKAFRQTGLRASRDVDIVSERPERTTNAIKALLDERLSSRSEFSLLYFRPDDPSIVSHLLSKERLQRLIVVDYFPQFFRRFEDSDARVSVFSNSVLRGVDRELVQLELSFDLIISAHQLTHSFAPMAFLSDCRRLLAAEGEIVIYDEDDHSSVQPFKFGTVGPNNFHKQLFTPRTMTSTLAAAGLAGPVASTSDLGLTAIVRQTGSKPPFVLGFDVGLISEIRAASRKSTLRRVRRHLREWRRFPLRLRHYWLKTAERAERARSRSGREGGASGSG